MINLLPPAIKTNRAYARHNSQAIKFTILLVSVALLLSLLMIGGAFFANYRASQLEDQLGTRQQQIQQLEPVRREAAGISESIDTIETLFDQQSYYSHFIAELGRSVPNWAAITSLTLERTDQTGTPDPTQGKRIDIRVALNDISRVSELRDILLAMERIEFVDIQQAQNTDTGAVDALFVLGLNTPAHQPLDDRESSQ